MCIGVEEPEHGALRGSGASVELRSATARGDDDGGAVLLRNRDRLVAAPTVDDKDFDFNPRPQPSHRVEGRAEPVRLVESRDHDRHGGIARFVRGVLHDLVSSPRPGPLVWNPRPKVT